MKKSKTPQSVVSQMLQQDYFSQWLGIKVIRVEEGSCELTMEIRKEMLNGFGIAHGGIAFSLADSALAFASNSRNQKSLVLDASISFIAPVNEGDTLTAVAEEANVTKRTGIYNITVLNGSGKKVALFKGIVFRKEEQWFTTSE